MALTNHILPDSPTNNFATWNPLYSSFDGTPTLSDGNLKATPNITQYHTAFSNLSVGSGKWYCEICITGNPNSANYFGIGTAQESDYLMNNQTLIGATAKGYSLELENGSNKRTNNSNTTIATPYIPFSNLNIFQIYMDLDAGKVWFGNNNTYASGGNPNNNTGETFSGLVGDFFIAITMYTNGITSAICNFGQDPSFGGNKNTPATVNGVTGPFAPSGTAAGTAGLFYYPPPTGALALCTANLPDFTPTVTGDVPQDYFKCLTYSGTYSQQDIAVGFKPDLVWAKSRTQTYGHMLYDTVRGQAHLNSDTADGEFSDTQLAFHSTDGFTVSASSGELNDSYGAPNNYIAWCWKAGGAPTASDDGTGVSGSAKLVDTSGIASSTTCKSFKDAAVTAGASNVICPSKMSINQAAGFSIVKYTGTGSSGTVPHGLDKKPDMVIIKNLDDGTKSWNITSFITTPSTVLTADTFNIGSKTGGVLALNLTNAANAYTIDGQTSGSGQNHIAYCWHSVEGYSAFGSYSGSYYHLPYIYTGFKPAFVMIKCASSDVSGYASWIIYDNARDPYNQMNKVLYANKSVGEGYRGNGTSTYSGLNLDFLSNGFKIRVAAAETNNNNGAGTGVTQPTYIFMAFAEQPFKYANAR